MPTSDAAAEAAEVGEAARGRELEVICRKVLSAPALSGLRRVGAGRARAGRARAATAEVVAQFLNKVPKSLSAFPELISRKGEGKE